MEQELSNADDLVKAMRSQREHRKELKEKDKKLCDELVAILNHGRNERPSIILRSC